MENESGVGVDGGVKGRSSGKKIDELMEFSCRTSIFSLEGFGLSTFTAVHNRILLKEKDFGYFERADRINKSSHLPSFDSVDFEV
ncbi:hypothetical protein ES288_A13G130900v1 [Gossypium darwinii]|uniref:Uncharacterized protein n=1 Tax=Gossypium darwinii TaxID=34276 RepID=A0A5D2DZ54_GOSDA|nr:hypothetical protein ES288_A13G130900v1 [Gossypium darwinii]